MSDAHLTQLLTQRREISADVVNVDEPLHQLVLVQIGDQSFAFLGKHIREILVRPTVYFVPGCPESMEGVINLRGSIESVIRLHGLLQVASQPASDQSGFVLMGETEQLTSGIRVEALIDMIEVVESALQPPPTSLPIHLTPYVSHIVSYQHKPVAVLSLQQLFADYAQGLG